MKFKLSENNSELILTQSTKEEYNQLKLSFNKFVKNYFFMAKFKLTPWDGKINFLRGDDRIHFGLWYEAYKICKEYGYPFILENKEQFPTNKTITKEEVEKFCKEFYVDHRLKGEMDKQFTPYEHQIEAIYKILKHEFGLIEVATAGGKSLIFGTLVFYYLLKINPKAKFLLIVPSISLVTQFYNDIMDYNIGYNNENKTPCEIKIDEIMSDKPRKQFDKEPNIYIGTYQSLEKWPDEFFKQFDVVCTDESHTAKSVSLIKILERTFGTTKIRFGMSGTYPPDGSAELFTIESLMGPKLLNIKAKKLMDEGIISTVKIKGLILNHNDRTFAENVFAIKKAGDGKKAYELEKKYSQNSQPRKIFLGKLITKFKQNSMLLFHNIEYGKELFNYFRDNIQDKDFYYIDGETSKDKRELIKKEMEKTDGNVKILIASFGTFSTGINLKVIVNLVFADSFKSDRLVRQSVGRVLRLHKDKEHAVIFDIVDQFHPDFKGILFNHFTYRKNEIYVKQQFPYTELKTNI
jgi:superfamily II DNA or RNA helicase